jgi:hypothetical protein
MAKTMGYAAAIILLIFSVAISSAAQAGLHSKDTEMAASEKLPPPPIYVAAPDPAAEAKRLYNRWMLSVSVSTLAGAVLGTALITSAVPVAAGAAAFYVTGAGIIAATAAAGGYLGALWVDY